MKSQNTEIRSSEIRALLNDTPSGFVRWGTIFILLAISSMVAVSWFLKYPDIVTANVTISNSNPPVPVLSPMKGILDAIFVKEGEEVIVDQPLAVFVSPGASYEDIQFLEAKLDVFNSNDIETFGEFSKYVDDPGDQEDMLELGSVRTAFNEFIGKLREYVYASAGDMRSLKISSSNKRIVDLKAEIKSDQAEIESYEERVYLKERTEENERDRYLGNKELKDPKPWEKAKNEASDARTALKEFNSSISAKEHQVIQLAKEIKDLRAIGETGITLIRNEINLKQEKLDGELKKWKQTHLLYAPLAGKVSFYEKKGKKEKQFFKEGENTMAILSKDKGGFVAQINLQKEHNGKVKEGDRVLMKLPSFPHHEYGKLRGEVTHIPKVPQEKYYAVKVSVPGESLITTFGKVIPFDEELVGTAEIITDDKRLFQRIYERVF